MVAAYTATHHRGYAHSVEVYQKEELVGGLYGISIGRAFFGESMFYHVPDASKVALYWLCRALAVREFSLIDCQQETDHMKKLGAVVIPRSEYLERLGLSSAHSGVVGSWSAFELFN
jgi:leucyl/phenylalanyl-tRNA--protein transferase